MEAAPSLLPHELTRYAYRAHQAAIRLPLAAAHLGLRPFARRRGVPPQPADMKALQRELAALLERDCANAEQGLYPTRLLFDMPVADYVKQLPSLATEIVRSMRRSKRKLVRDLPTDVDLGAYPDYFRRNFHWQTDGYFSERSAAVYDIGVEFLFLGTADVMRRQIVPPVTRYLRARPKSAGRSASCSTAIARSVVPFGLVTRRRSSAGSSPDARSSSAAPRKVVFTMSAASSGLKPFSMAALVSASTSRNT